MVDHLDDLRERDRTARNARVYGHESSKKERDRRVGPKPGDAGQARAIRHADERGEQQRTHRNQSEEVRRKFEKIRNEHLKTGERLPGNLDRDEAVEFRTLHEKHSHERAEMSARHLRERVEQKPDEAQRPEGHHVTATIINAEGLNRRHQREREEMHKRHRTERRDLHGNHRAERDQLFIRQRSESDDLAARHAEETL
jgi:hypothetical protein